ncbi:hypothetical protein LFAB_03315 [Lactiplantibacillus fabifermentans T30PCM01]|uniref:Uncharacterized protein n=1 Tax=Lactiplantibacillus fabifermentans T30PCM01 TaxID=1400520 RepID=W6T9K9_9LACO|nr:hypothetical protein LFAB_03315 [Lactiplantibacillus fabifermentans T30PCM01]
MQKQFNQMQMMMCCPCCEPNNMAICVELQASRQHQN